MLWLQLALGVLTVQLSAFHTRREPDRFAAMARKLSKLPMGRNLGQIARGDTVPEFEKALFRLGSIGLLTELVRTRYGFHIVAVDNRILGTTLPFEIARNRIAGGLRAAVEESALRQYLRLLAGQADIAGVDLGASTSPLVQCSKAVAAENSPAALPLGKYDGSDNDDYEFFESSASNRLALQTVRSIGREA